MWITSSLTTALTPASVALGNFDGIHQGHRQVMQPILSPSLRRQPLSVPPLTAESYGENFPPNPKASLDDAPETSLEPYPTLVTFNPHPQEFFSGQRRTLLTPLSEKVKYLEAIGVQQLVLLPFDQDLANMTPEAFVEEILVGQLNAQQISVGQDFCFGRQRSGTVTELKAIAARHGVKVHLVPLKTANGDRISSSAIREALLQGNLKKANSILGRPYSLIGEVVQGKQIGRTIGFPTANLQLPPEKFLPRHGVYAVRVYGASSLGEQEAVMGALNIGTRPTVDEIASPTVEVHLLDWSGDLYGKTLTLHLEHFLRPQQKFDSLDQLKAQIQTDCDSARTLLSAQE